MSKSGNVLIRQLHRWVSILFTLTVIANFIMLGMGEQIMLITYSPLPFLAVLLLSGLYLFALPYLARNRRAERAA